MEDLESEFDDWFGKFRNMVYVGISRYSDTEVGDLFAVGSYLNASWEIITGDWEKEYNRYKVNLDNTHAAEMAEHRDIKTVNQRDILVRSEKPYLTASDAKLNAENQYIIHRQKTKALAIAVNSLSREMSRRMK